MVVDNAHLLDDWAWELLYLLSTSYEVALVMATSTQHYELKPQYYKPLIASSKVLLTCATIIHRPVCLDCICTFSACM